MKSYHSLFVVIEGPSGSGKSTLNAALSQALEISNLNILSTREPTDNFNRNLENTSSGEMLYAAFIRDRMWHVINEIKPALVQGSIVICDRYIPSTLTYQCLEGMNFDKVYSENERFPIPDLVIYLDVDENELSRRLDERSELTRFENRDFRTKEINQYKIVMEKLSQKGWAILTIDNDNVSLKDNVQTIISIIVDIQQQKIVLRS